jgi:hypothetical protein
MVNAIKRLWRGEVALARTFWEYAILYGTLLNILTTIATLAALAANLPVVVALALHLMPTPYNVFVVIAVWRSALRYRGRREWSVLARAGVIGWALIACVA